MLKKTFNKSINKKKIIIETLTVAFAIILSFINNVETKNGIELNLLNIIIFIINISLMYPIIKNTDIIKKKIIKNYID